MPQSLSLVIVHVIFSTKDRLELIDPDTRPKLHAYLATVARNLDCEAYRVGGVGDHVHLALRLSRTITIAIDRRIKNLFVQMDEGAIAATRCVCMATRLCLFLRWTNRFESVERIH